MRTWRDGRSVVIAIEDTGGGIPEAIRSKIFDPFFTAKAIGKTPSPEPSPSPPPNRHILKAFPLS